MFSIDLKDVYFQVLIQSQSRLFLHFTFSGMVYKFKDLFLPFDSMTRLLQGVMLISMWTHQHGIHLQYFIIWAIGWSLENWFHYC